MPKLTALLTRWRFAVKKWKDAMEVEVLSVEEVRTILHRDSSNCTLDKVDGVWKLVPKVGVSTMTLAHMDAKAVEHMTVDPSELLPPTAPELANTGNPLRDFLVNSANTFQAQDACEHDWLRGRTKQGPIATCTKCLVSKPLTEAEFLTIR